MNLNRNQQPDYINIEEIDIPSPKKIFLNNGIETHIINAGTQDIVKIDISFNAGSWYQKKALIAAVVNEMLTEGTTTQSSQQISEKLDYFGAFIHAQPTKDFGEVSLYTLKKHLPETIKILEDIVKNPVFAENEMQTFLSKRKQKFQIELEKVTNIARQEFNEQLFGKNHPYGIKTKIEDYEKVNQSDLTQFHDLYYNSKNCKIILSGKVDSSVIELVNNHFGSNDWSNKNKIASINKSIVKHPIIESFIEKKNVTQSAIRLGKIVINKNHPDFHKLNVVNTILGGYFGSRLMKTIREEKGYTYGIGSALVSLKNVGFLVILSEVGADVSQNAITDIIAEVKKLREEKVDIDELNLVKNYMLGDLLRSFDGPFEISSSFKSIIELDIENDFYHKALKCIKSITADEIIAIANKYLHEDTLIKTIAGKYN
ncbi:MAG: insulinase family protein [Bacteroidales bacterium]|nr:insulinase family protein [Bacteroidales bacterium]